MRLAEAPLPSRVTLSGTSGPGRVEGASNGAGSLGPDPEVQGRRSPATPLVTPRRESVERRGAASRTAPKKGLDLTAETRSGVPGGAGEAETPLLDSLAQVLSAGSDKSGSGTQGLGDLT